MISEQDALNAVPGEVRYLVVGIRGETPTHYVIDREPVMPGDDFDAPIPLVHKVTGELVWTLALDDNGLLDEFVVRSSS